MLTNMVLSRILLFLILIFGLSTWSCHSSGQADQGRYKSADPEQGQEDPLVIWYHSGEHRSTRSLRTVLKSDLITHVVIKYRHLSDGEWNEDPYVREAIEIVRRSNAKLIWARTMWPWYVVEDSRPQDLYDPSYYIRQIQNLRAEAAEMGADMVALDMEPYANSPMKVYFKGGDRIWLNAKQLRDIQDAVNRAIEVAGKVDIVFPAGSMNRSNPYNILARFGEIRVSEHTYYDNPSAIKNIKYPYEMFGVQLSTVKENEKQPHLPYYLVEEIFEKKYLWSGTKGLFIYTSSRSSFVVAKALAAYGQRLKDAASEKTERSSDH